MKFRKTMIKLPFGGACRYPHLEEMCVQTLLSQWLSSLYTDTTTIQPRTGFHFNIQKGWLSLFHNTPIPPINFAH